MGKGSVVLEYFPEARVALNKEIHYHPNLCKMLAELQRVNPSADFPEKLAVICTYCGVVIEGYFTGEELDRLAHRLVFMLQQNRKIIIH